MTLSGQALIGAATQPGPRTTTVSFVVHRTGDVWLFASAHNTDVIPNMETVFRSADYPSDHVS